MCGVLQSRSMDLSIDKLKKLVWTPRFSKGVLSTWLVFVWKVSNLFEHWLSECSWILKSFLDVPDIVFSYTNVKIFYFPVSYLGKLYPNVHNVYRSNVIFGVSLCIIGSFTLSISLVNISCCCMYFVRLTTANQSL